MHKWLKKASQLDLVLTIEIRAVIESAEPSKLVEDVRYH